MIFILCDEKGEEEQKQNRCWNDSIDLAKELFEAKATDAQCLKITKKSHSTLRVSYIYILSGQKFIKTAKNGPFWRVFETLKLAAK